MENLRRSQSSMLPPLTPKELWSYGVGDFFGGGTFFIIGLLFLFYMTDVVGLTPALAGLVFIIGKAWDAIIDPVMGYLSDNTQSRFGRRRLYFLAGAIPGGVSFALLWLPVTYQADWAKFLYYLTAFIFFTTAFTVLMVPYTAFGAEIHPDYKQRNRLTTVRMLCSQLSVLIGGVVPQLIIRNFEDRGQGHLTMGMAFGAFYVLPWILVFFGTREKPWASPLERMAPKDFFRSFGSVFQNRSFRIHLAMYLCAYTAVDLVMALLRYFMKYVLDRENLLSVALGVLLLAQMAMLPVYLGIANRHGKGKAYVVGLAIWLAAMIPVGFLPPTTPSWILILLCAVLGAGISAGVMIPWAVLPSLSDVDELITAQKRVGLYSGVMTFTRKLIQAGALYGLSLGLEFSGYRANVAQSDETVFMLRMLYILGPGIVLAIGIWAGLKLRLTAYTHGVLTDELLRLKAGGRREEATAEARTVCEELTGKPYAQLYPATEVKA